MAKGRTVAALSVSINASTKGLRKGLARATSMLKSFAGTVATTIAAIAGIGTAIAGVGAAAVTAGVAGTIRSFDKLAKTSDKLNIKPTALLALRDAAKESGVEVKTFDLGFQRMLRRIQEAASGKGEAKDVLKALGLDARVLSKFRPEQQFEQVARAYANATDKTKDLARGMKLFDSEGVVVINTLRKVAEKGLNHYMHQVEMTNRAVERADLVPAEDIFDRLTEMGNTFSGVFSKLALTVIGPLASALEPIAAKLQQAFLQPAFLKNVEALRAALHRVGQEFAAWLWDIDVVKLMADIEKGVKGVYKWFVKLGSNTELNRNLALVRQELGELWDELSKWVGENTSADKIAETIIEGTKKLFSATMDFASNLAFIVEQIANTIKLIRSIPEIMDMARWNVSDMMMSAFPPQNAQTAALAGTGGTMGGMPGERESMRNVEALLEVMKKVEQNTAEAATPKKGAGDVFTVRVDG